MRSSEFAGNQTMRNLVAAVSMIAASTAVNAAGSFPATMQGVWAASPAACRTYHHRGIRGLREDRADWVEIRGAVLMNSDPEVSGRFIKIGYRGMSEATIASQPSGVQYLDLNRSGVLDISLNGARASALYVRCTGDRY
jgi:hypothetical protein